MQLYLARHAEAVRVGGEIVHDADRILTAKGVEDASLMGRALALLDPKLEIVVTSPLKRAVQTGELMGKEAGNRPVFHTSANLAPGFHQQSLLEELLSLAGDGSVLAIGHQPDIGDFLSSLVAGSAPIVISLPPAAVARVFIPSGASSDEAALQWLLTPDLVKNFISKP